MTLTQLTGQLKQYSEPNGDAMNPNQPLLPLAHPQPQQAIIKEQRIDPNYSRTHNSKATFASFCCSKGMSLFLSIFIISVSLAILIVELAVFRGMSDSNYQTTQTKLGVRLGLSIPCGLAIVYYIILIFTCGTFKYIMNNNNAENTYNFIDLITGTKPTISLSVSCYHYETVYETYTDSNGETQTRTREERVTTYSETRHFNFQYYRDLSRPFLLEGTSKEYIKLDLSFVTFLSNQATKQALDQARTSIQVDNRWRDTFMDFSESWGLPGFKKKILARINPNQSNFFHPMCYLLFSVFCMNGLYRFIFDRKCGEQSYQFVKEISINPFPQEMVTVQPSYWMNTNYGCVSTGEAFTYQRSYNANQKDYMPPLPAQPGISEYMPPSQSYDPALSYQNN